jgi:hypothetical protein
MVRRFFKDIFPWLLLVSFFVMGITMAVAIGRGLRHGGSPPPAPSTASESDSSAD